MCVLNVVQVSVDHTVSVTILRGEEQMNVRQMTAGAINRGGVPSAAHAQSGYEKVEDISPGLHWQGSGSAGRGRAGLPARAAQPLLLQNGQAFPQHRRKRCTRPAKKNPPIPVSLEVQNITTHVRQGFPISSRRIAQSGFRSRCYQLPRVYH